VVRCSKCNGSGSSTRSPDAQGIHCYTTHPLRVQPVLPVHRDFWMTPPFPNSQWLALSFRHLTQKLMNPNLISGSARAGVCSMTTELRFIQCCQLLITQLPARKAMSALLHAAGGSLKQDHLKLCVSIWHGVCVIMKVTFRRPFTL
jgi:hypothetical protein